MSPMEIFMAMQETSDRDEAIAILRTEREGWLVRVLPPAERMNKKCHFCEVESQLPNPAVKYVVNTYDPLIDVHGRSQVFCCGKCLIKMGGRC